MVPSRSFGALGLIALAALAGVASVSATPARTTGVLALTGSVQTLYRFDDAACPAGASTATAECVRFVGQGEIPGLGRVTTTYVKVLPGDDPSCVVVNHNEAVIDVAGKGTITLTRPGRLCGPPAPATLPPSRFMVQGGTGAYAGASGTLMFDNTVNSLDGACRCGTGVDRWRGELTVPGLDFDTTAPTLSGAVSKNVRVPRKAKGARVRFVVTAQDAVDGTLPVECTPRPGTFFPVGRSTVECTASDTSGNSASAKFAVIVKRARA